MHFHKASGINTKYVHYFYASNNHGVHWRSYFILFLKNNLMRQNSMAQQVSV